MNRIGWLCVAGIVGVLTCASFAAGQPAVQTLALPAISPSQKHEVKIVVPGEYANFPNRKYVSVYLLDSQYDPYFQYVKTTFDYLTAQGYMQPVILVGVSSAARQFDFTPVAQTPAGKAAYMCSGGADEYYKYLGDEVVATVEKSYRCEPFRVAIGHSLGGTFLVHCMLAHKDLINANIIISPNLVYDEDQLVHRLEQPESAAALKNRFVYLANGKGDRYEDKFQPGTMKVAKLLQATPTQSLHFIYDDLANDSHGTTAVEGVPKGIVKLFQQLMYSSDKLAMQVEQKSDSIVSDMDESYKRASQWSGLALPMVWDINVNAYNCYGSKRTDLAIKLLELGLAAHPDDLNLLDSAAELAQAAGDLNAARKSCVKGLDVLEQMRASLPAERYASSVARFQKRAASLDAKS